MDISIIMLIFNARLSLVFMFAFVSRYPAIYGASPSRHLTSHLAVSRMLSCWLRVGLGSNRTCSGISSRSTATRICSHREKDPLQFIQPLGRLINALIVTISILTGIKSHLFRNKIITVYITTPASFPRLVIFL